MNEKIIELLEDLSEYYKGNDWLIVKKFLLKYLHPDIRKQFTTRHYTSKKHSLNNFEKQVINYYYNIHNIRLELYEKDKHKEK
jgi:hypothetical protein